MKQSLGQRVSAALEKLVESGEIDLPFTVVLLDKEGFVKTYRMYKTGQATEMIEHRKKASFPSLMFVVDSSLNHVFLELSEK